MGERRLLYPVVRFRVELDPSDELQDLVSGFFEKGDESRSRLKFHTTAERVISRADYREGLSVKEVSRARTKLERIGLLLAKDALVLAHPIEGRPIVGGHKLIFDAEPNSVLSDITNVLNSMPSLGVPQERTRVAIDLARAGLKNAGKLGEARDKLLDAMDGSTAGELTLGAPQLKSSMLPNYSISDTYYPPEDE